MNKINLKILLNLANEGRDLARTIIRNENIPKKYRLEATESLKLYNNTVGVLTEYQGKQPMNDEAHNDGFLNAEKAISSLLLTLKKSMIVEVSESEREKPTQNISQFLAIINQINNRRS